MTSLTPHKEYCDYRNKKRVCVCVCVCVCMYLEGSRTLYIQFSTDAPPNLYIVVIPRELGVQTVVIQHCNKHQNNVTGGVNKSA